MINLFICILDSIGAESNIRDIGLLSMGAGFFGYLDYLSDATISFHFIQGLVGWARLAESRAAEQECTNPLFPVLETIENTVIPENLDNPYYYGVSSGSNVSVPYDNMLTDAARLTSLLWIKWPWRIGLRSFLLSNKRVRRDCVAGIALQQRPSSSSDDGF